MKKETKQIIRKRLTSSQSMLYCDYETKNKDTKIRYAVCMWKDLTIDMMSRHLLKSLVDLDPANKETLVILRTVGGFHTKPFQSCLPNQSAP